MNTCLSNLIACMFLISHMLITYSQIFRDIASGFIQHPEKLIILNESITRSFSLLRVECAPIDYSQIIGKSARHVKAFQHLLGYIAGNRNEKVDLSVRGPGEKILGSQNPKRPLSACVNDRICELLTMILKEAIQEPFKLNAFNRDLVSYIIILTETELEPDLLESLQSLMQATAKVSGHTLRLENDFSKP